MTGQPSDDRTILRLIEERDQARRELVELTVERDQLARKLNASRNAGAAAVEAGAGHLYRMREEMRAVATQLRALHKNNVVREANFCMACSTSWPCASVRLADDLDPEGAAS